MGARQDHINYFLAVLDKQSVVIARAFMQAADQITDHAVLRALADAIITGDVMAVMRILNLDAAALDPLTEAIRQTFIAGAGSASAGLAPNGYGAKMLAIFNTRSPLAEAWLADIGATRVTGYLNEMQDTIRVTMLAGMERGDNPLTTARALVGALKVSGKYRKGGTLMLTRQNAITVEKVRTALKSGDLEGLRHYLTLKMRDKRFDRAVRKALASGAPISPDLREKILAALADKYLRERAKTIARTEALAAINYGKAEAFRQATERAGVDAQYITRTWSSTGDLKVRPDHVHLDGQKVTGLNTPYRLPNGGYIMRPGDMAAGASQVIKCRCIEYLEVDWLKGRG